MLELHRRCAVHGRILHAPLWSRTQRFNRHCLLYGINEWNTIFSSCRQWWLWTSPWVSYRYFFLALQNNNSWSGNRFILTFIYGNEPNDYFDLIVITMSVRVQCAKLHSANVHTNRDLFSFIHHWAPYGCQ